MNTIILLTNHYPFGIYESFLDQEIPYLRSTYDKVIIIARDVTSPVTRSAAGIELHRVNPVSSASEKVLTAWLMLTKLPTILKLIRDERLWLSKNRPGGTEHTVRPMLHAIGKALITAHHIERIGNVGPHDAVTLYSYWLNTSALAVTLANPNASRIVRIARAHGGDVYEYRTPKKYLPFRYQLSKGLDRIYAISRDGQRHLQKQFDKDDQRKVDIARLGTLVAEHTPAASNVVTIVSCSFLVEVKRVDLLIAALALVNVPFHWIHVGDGPLMPAIRSKGEELLSGKTASSFTLKGNLTNDKLREFYAHQDVTLFVNTSSSEGVPVSMMEAQSFGIPCVGPKTGGVPEIINDSCGRLFDVNASPAVIADAISSVLQLAPADYQAMRSNALRNWSDHYNAANNFSTFVAEIQNLQR